MTLLRRRLGARAREPSGSRITLAVSRNPSFEPELRVELKTGAHFPNGVAVTILGEHVEDLLDPGESDIPLLSMVVPGNLPNGAYTIEAAILDPISGVTLSRATLAVTKQ